MAIAMGLCTSGCRSYRDGNGKSPKTQSFKMTGNCWIWKLNDCSNDWNTELLSGRPDWKIGCKMFPIIFKGGLRHINLHCALCQGKVGPGQTCRRDDLWTEVIKCGAMETPSDGRYWKLILKFSIAEFDYRTPKNWMAQVPGKNHPLSIGAPPNWTSKPNNGQMHWVNSYLRLWAPFF